MDSGRFYRSGTERQGERASVVPRVPLVHVVGAEKISGLSGYDVQSRPVEVGEIRGESFRGSMMPGNCFYGVAAARLHLPPRPPPRWVVGIFPHTGG